MPATAGRVRMPANNRVHSSAALQTHGIWQSAIGYDPYAPNKEEKKDKSSQKSTVPEPETENAYASFQGLLALARITGSNADEARGACKKCGRVGHLTFQCRNFLSAKDEADKDSKDAEAIQAAVLSGLEKLKGERVRVNGKSVSESDESSEEESETSDSDYDSDIERAIAERYGKSLSHKKLSSKNQKKYDDDELDDDRSESKSKERRKRERKERGRSKKRSAKRGYTDSDDEDEGRRKRRREKRRRRDDDDTSDEDEERKRRRRKTRKEKHRRSHRDLDHDSSDDSTKQRHKRRHRRAHSVSDFDGSGSDDPRVGRHKKRSDKKTRNRRHEED